MAEVLLKAVSPFGVKFGDNEGWTNFDKKSGLTKDGFHAGDAVELTQNAAGFITAMKVVTAAPPKKAWSGGGFNKGPVDPEKSNKMARGAAVKAVMDSPYVAEQLKDTTLGEGLKQMLAISEEVANYIEKGL